jgi:hypothetical protein
MYASSQCPWEREELRFTDLYADFGGFLWDIGDFRNMDVLC